MTRRDFSESDIHLSLDGELPASDQAAYREWLTAHPDMQARAQRYEGDLARLKAAVDPVLNEEVPAALLEILDARPRQRSRRWFLSQAAAAAALLAVGGATGYLLRGLAGAGGSEERRIALDAIDAHVVYAAEKLHVVEVPADQRDHLQGWLSKRVGLTLVAPDLTGRDLDLVGGRLLPAEGHSAAQFMYQDRAGNRVSLFVTTDAARADTGFRLVEAASARAYFWLDQGYACAVAGTMPAADLLVIAQDAYRQLLNTASG